MSRAAVEADIRETLGLVPSFFAEVPDTLIGSEWASFKALELSETAIPNKYKELIGLAVSGATRCRYCAFFHAEAARLFGATDEEIAEAALMAKHTMGWSTYLNTLLVDEETFRAEFEQIAAYVRSQARPPRPPDHGGAHHPHAGERRHARRHLPGALGAGRRGAHGPLADARRPAGPRRGPGDARARPRRLRRRPRPRRPRRSPVHVLIINFRLADMDEEGYRAACAEMAPAFAELPGLLAKVWLAPRRRRVRRRLPLPRPRVDGGLPRLGPVRHGRGLPPLHRHRRARLRRLRGPHAGDAARA